MIKYRIKGIEELMVDLGDPKIEPEATIEKFIAFYLLFERHRYAKVASYINKKQIDDGQTVSFILEKLEMILEICKSEKEVINQEISNIKNDLDRKENTLNCTELICKLEKLVDHIELEQMRMTYSQKTEKKTFSTLFDRISSRIEEANANIEKKGKEIEQNLTGSVISVLGIFAAFITTFFAGLNAFSSIMTNLKDVSKFRIIFAILLLAFILFNIIFVLLYSLAKILDKNIGCYIPWSVIRSNPNDYKDNGKKKRNKMFIKWCKIKTMRFPIVAIFNIIVFIGMIITIVLKILDHWNMFHF